MVGLDISICPNCRGSLKYYDSVPRVVRTRGRETDEVKIRRLRCTNCRKIHREIPEDIYPYKQYEAEIIRGVLEGLITPDTFGFEDYPCEATMRKWQMETYEQMRLDRFFDMETSSELTYFTHKLQLPL